MEQGKGKTVNKITKNHNIKTPKVKVKQGKGKSINKKNIRP
jgi:hypothetical protein